jgi:hypothetical protein
MVSLPEGSLALRIRSCNSPQTETTEKLGNCEGINGKKEEKTITSFQIISTFHVHGL